MIPNFEIRYGKDTILFIVMRLTSILFLSALWSYAQPVTVDLRYMNALIHDVQSLHKCSKALDSAEWVISEGRKLLVKAEEGIEIITIKSAMQDILISTLRAQIEVDKEIHHEKERGLKVVIRKLWLFVISEGLIIALLLI